jgi:HAE1 family hydrophobic/amphiphilic exporter-1
MKEVAGILAVNHSGQLPSVTISFNLKSGYSLSQAVDKVDAEISRMLPSSVAGYFQGTAQAFKESMSGMLLLLVITILVIYIQITESPTLQNDHVINFYRLNNQ